MAGAGKRTERITFSRPGETQDEYGEETGGNPTELGSAKAAVFWGSGSERRGAAREGGSQAASFVCLATGLTRGVRVKDTIGHSSGDFDIRGIVPRGRREIEFEAVRSA